MAHWHELADGSAGAVPGLQNLVRWDGNMQWEFAPDELARLGEQHASWGYDVRRTSNAELIAREPWLSDSILPTSGWCLSLPEEGSVEADDAARLMVAHAQGAFGARLVTAEVDRLLVKGDGEGASTVSGVITVSGDTILADHVVLAAGLGVVPLCAAVGITVPVKGRPGLLVHSKPIPQQRLLRGLAITSGPHMRQTVEGRILAGANFAGTDPGKDPQTEADALFAKVKEAFRPTLAGADGTETSLPVLELDYYTIGNRPDPQDGLPILGASGLPGLTLAVMHSGVTVSAIVGQTISDLVITGKEDPDLASFALSRFTK